MTIRAENSAINPVLKQFLTHNDAIDSNNLGKFAFCPQFADFEFTVENEKVIVHKPILLARCEVFERIYSNEDVKQVEEFANIPNVSKEAFKNFLTYLYTDALLYANKYADDYLQLSEKFGVAAIKDKIVESFTKSLDDNTAFDIFRKVHQYNLDEELKLESFKIIQK